MKKRFIVLSLLLFVFGLANSASAELIGGVEFPDGAVSFADAVVSFSAGAGTVAPYNNPNLALGIPDYPAGDADGHVSLGSGGSLILSFTDNALTTSGDSALDLYIFEVGGSTENMRVWISTNGIDFVLIGDVAGQPTGIDIDAYTASGVVLGALYSYVKIADLAPNTSGSPYAGADIDAVGAISSAPPAVPEPATMLLLGTGLAGLACLRRKFRK